MNETTFERPSAAERAWWTAVFLWHLRRERRLPWQPVARTRAIQDRRVRRIVRHAYRTVPFYREAFDRLGLLPRHIRRAEDLALLPLVDSRELATDPERFRSGRFRRGRTLTLPTTGTTGLWKPIEYDRATLVANWAAGMRWHTVIERLAGRSAGLRRMGFSPENGTSQALTRAWSQLVWIPARFAPRDQSRSIAEPPAASIAALNEARPDVVGGFGAHLGALFRRASMLGLEVYRPRVITFGGDTMAVQDRDLIETQLGVPVVSSYQACEALRIAFQCEQRQGFHLYLDHVHLRVIGDNGQDVPPGETGQVLISNLLNRATVLLNFRLGDLAVLSPKPCPCGRTLPCVERLEGRTDDLLLRPTGEQVHESVVLRRLYDTPGVVRLQVVQHGPISVVVSVVPTPSAAWEDLQSSLRATVRDLLGAPDAEVAVERVSEIASGPGGKYRAVIRKSAAIEAARPDG